MSLSYRTLREAFSYCALFPDGNTHPFSTKHTCIKAFQHCLVLLFLSMSCLGAFVYILYRQTNKLERNQEFVATMVQCEEYHFNKLNETAYICINTPDHIDCDSDCMHDITLCAHVLAQSRDLLCPYRQKYMAIWIILLILLILTSVFVFTFAIHSGIAVTDMIRDAKQRGIDIMDMDVRYEQRQLYQHAVHIQPQNNIVTYEHSEDPMLHTE